MTPCDIPHRWHLKTSEFMPGFVVMVWRCRVCETTKTQHRVMPDVPHNTHRSAGYAANWQQRYTNWR